jgi:Haem-binding uptake, Tiki superfamily, ChaN
MGSISWAESRLRSRRRSAGERHALASVERQIRATDPKLRRKYLSDFNQAFTSYQRVLSRAQLDAIVTAADVALVGDYHALAAAQGFAAQIVERLAQAGRPVVLGVETLFARDQHILDEWLRGEIDDEELRQRVRFDREWGYDWQPTLELLKSGRTHALATYGLDCMPRHDLRTIAARDRHAALKIAELRQRHPQATVVALFGESHLAPNHLPLALRLARPHDRVLTVLQNSDPLYWRVAGEPQQKIEAVQVEDDVVCVFNATPLEKYESYRLCIERWRQERPAPPDLAPTYYNLLDALLHFLSIDKYSSHNGTQPKYLVDLLPEIHCRASLDSMKKLLERRATGQETKAVMEQIQRRGSCYAARCNAIFVGRFRLVEAAEDVARFLHSACRGEVFGKTAEAGGNPEDGFYRCTLEHALAYFGSRLLYPARMPARESDLYSLYAMPPEEIERQTLYGYREFMQMVDFLILHKDFENNRRQYYQPPELIAEGTAYAGEKRVYTTRQLGNILGTQLFDAYVEGRVSKPSIRAMYMVHLDQPGAARDLYFSIAQRTRRLRPE